MTEANVSAISESRAGLDWQALVRYLFVLGQLALLALVIRQFGIENAAFLQVYLLAVGGFAVFYFLPGAWQLPFFACLSVSAIALVLGPMAAVNLIAIGLLLIGICHLPMGWGWRIATLIAVAALLAVFRSEVIATPIPISVWPILGAMFMFRLVVYVYDFRHDKTPPDFWSSVAYFFMLPNVCFPLFPVIDYKSFRRHHMDRELFEISNLGTTWILRGITHLILYRIVYYYFTLTPEDVTDPDSLTQFLVANFLLYLRVSGHFHLIVGMLHLFGFRLPETHHRYVLSASFTDFWRRINIYWKDFMMKVFYFPLFFRLRRFGETPALVIATGLVFVGTWAAHSYQWFWLRGSFPVVWQDMAFWGFLAMLVVINTLWELKKGRKRSLSSHWTLQEKLVLGIKTVATFFAIVILWSIWTSASLSSWLSMWQFEDGWSFPWYFLWVASVIFVGAILFGRERKASDARSKVLFSACGIEMSWAQLRGLAMLGFLTLLGVPPVYTRLGTEAGNLVLSLKSEQLNRADAAELQRGYYEDLTRVDRFNSKLWEVYMDRPDGWLFATGSGLTRMTGDFSQTELVPSMKSTTEYGIISTNRWGMRDQEYEQIPQTDTYRLAIIGESNTMGWGVADDETFESLVERNLNSRLPEDRWQNYELLNLGVPGHFPPQKVFRLRKALTFEPQAVIYVATGRELYRSAYSLADSYIQNVDLPITGLKRIAEEADLADASDVSDARRKLTPYWADIVRVVYKGFVETSIAAGVHPIYVFLPPIGRPEGWEEEADAGLQIAREVGFHIIDLSHLYRDGNFGEDLKIAEWDAHPNATGHEMIARELFAGIQRIWPDISHQPNP